MKVFRIMLVLVMLSTAAFAKDVTLKDIPDGVSEQQVQEWVAILVERYETAKINQNPVIVQATKEAQTSIDLFRKANALQTKFNIEEVEEEPISIVEKADAGINWEKL